MKKIWISLFVVIIAVAGLIVFAQTRTTPGEEGVDPEAVSDVVQTAPSEKPDTIVVGTQYPSTTLTIESARAEVPSFIAVHVMGSAGRPGLPIGQSQEFMGEQSDIEVPIRRNLPAGTQLFAVLYKKSDPLPKAYDPVVDPVDFLSRNVVVPFFIAATVSPVP